jgi:Uncharacterized ACR, COG1753.
MHIMAKTIAVSDETYNLLKNSKADDESFSDLIKKSLKKRSRLARLIGSRTLDRKDWEKVKHIIEKSELMTEEELSKLG